VKTGSGALNVSDLRITFHLREAPVRAVRGVSFDIPEGTTMGLVGESGCGKSVTAFSLLRLLKPPARIESGKIIFRDRDILAMEEEELRHVRGREISMIFQEPMTSLNPVFTVGYQIMESILLHTGKKGSEARDFAAAMLKLVGIPDSMARLDSYPHEFSGGMRQRVMIAMALSASPSLLIADEPTTALDVTIQAQILDLLMKLQEKRKMSMLLITHDLGIVANTADSVSIMYAGEIVESGKTKAVFSDARHPYTEGLFNAIPLIGRKTKRLKTIPGTVPSLAEEPGGCVFFPRCYKGSKECTEAPVRLRSIARGHLVRCIKA
jgi:oligopeptide/dipeptide ABC transporter ATP-binding protein